MAIPLNEHQVARSLNHHIYEYEVNESESLTFLYNLLYDKQSCLSQADILDILNNFKNREDCLPFAITSVSHNDSQGVHWNRDLFHKFKLERSRIGKNNWYFDFEGSREKSLKSTNLNSIKCHTEFYKFHKFFTKLKLHINHFQLRNLVCCGSNVSKGVYYPTSCFHDYNLEAVHTNSFHDSPDEEHSPYFKVNRLMPDNTVLEKSQSMKLDCLIDSRVLSSNSNNRISTLSCTDKYLACGTYGESEGGFVLSDIEDPDNVKTIGDIYLSEAITNHIIVNEHNSELVISSNDKKLRFVNISNLITSNTINLPFAINCASMNKHNLNEIFLVGDDLKSYIIDKRIKHDCINRAIAFEGHHDFGFSCDWSSENENLLLTGNQDSCVKLWDKRKSDESMFSWSGSLGSSNINNGGPVRNCKFSNNGEFITWAESLDHVGIIQVEDLNSIENDKTLSRIQSIDFIGKCVGLAFAPIENGYGEQLIIGVNDCPLGGILSYKLESRQKTLDFDFHF